MKKKLKKRTSKKITKSIINSLEEAKLHAKGELDLKTSTHHVEEEKLTFFQRAKNNIQYYLAAVGISGVAFFHQFHELFHPILRKLGLPCP